MIILDFETESEEDISLGAYAYAIHPTTDVLCLSWRPLKSPQGTERIWFPGKSLNPVFLLRKILGCEGNNPNVFSPSGSKIPAELERAIDDGAEFHAHNAFFEQCIWNLVMVKKYGWPQVPTDRWHCSAAQSSYHGFSRSLDRSCLGTGTKVAKDVEGSSLMRKMSPIGKRTKKVIDKWDLNLYRLGQYCKADVAAESELIKSIPALPELEQEIWLCDQDINLRGIPLDKELVKAGSASSDLLQKDAKKRLPELTGGKVRKPGEIAKIQKWVDEERVSFYPPIPNLQAATVSQLLKDEAIPEKVKEVLQIRQDAGTAAIKKYKKEFAAVKNDLTSRFRGGFVYYGAHTGRWTGQIVQPSNMPRAHFPTDEDTEKAISAIKSNSLENMTSADCVKKGERKTATNTLTKCVRASITATAGKTFVAADWTGIELRVLTWFAKDEKGLQRIVEKGSSQLYLDMAKVVFGRDVSKSETFEYTVGKAGRLGCGYGMGPYARELGEDGKFRPLYDDYGRPYGGFVEYARSYGIEINDSTLPLAEKVVKVYREENPLVKQLWDRCHKAAVSVVETGYPKKINDVKFSVRVLGKKRAMVLELPSGRELFYPWVGIEERKGRKSLVYWGDKNKKWVKNHLYGGLIVENIVQAMSRDILTPAMLSISKVYDIVSHCYDEIVCEVTIDKAEECVKFMDEEMCKPLFWSSGLSLETEIWSGKRYKK